MSFKDSIAVKGKTTPPLKSVYYFVLDLYYLPSIYLRWVFFFFKRRLLFSSCVRRVNGAATGGVVFGTLLATYRGHSVPFYAAGMGTNYAIASFAFFGEQHR